MIKFTTEKWIVFFNNLITAIKHIMLSYLKTLSPKIVVKSVSKLLVVRWKVL